MKIHTLGEEEEDSITEDATTAGLTIEDEVLLEG